MPSGASPTQPILHGICWSPAAETVNPGSRNAHVGSPAGLEGRSSWRIPSAGLTIVPDDPDRAPRLSRMDGRRLVEIIVVIVGLAIRSVRSCGSRGP